MAPRRPRLTRRRTGHHTRADTRTNLAILATLAILGVFVSRVRRRGNLHRAELAENQEPNARRSARRGRRLTAVVARVHQARPLAERGSHVVVEHHDARGRRRKPRRVVGRGGFVKRRRAVEDVQARRRRAGGRAAVRVGSRARRGGVSRAHARQRQTHAGRTQPPGSVPPEPELSNLAQTPRLARLARDPARSILRAFRGGVSVVVSRRVSRRVPRDSAPRLDDAPLVFAVARQHRECDKASGRRAAGASRGRVIRAGNSSERLRERRPEDDAAFSAQRRAPVSRLVRLVPEEPEKHARTIRAGHRDRAGRGVDGDAVELGERRRPRRDAGRDAPQARRPEPRRANAREPTRLRVVPKHRALAGVGERHQGIDVRARITRSRVLAFAGVGGAVPAPAAARDFQGDQRASGGLLALQPHRFAAALLVGREQQQLVALPEHHGQLAGRAEPPAHRVCHDGRRHQRRGDESGGFRGFGCVFVRLGVRRTVARVRRVAARNRHGASCAAPTSTTDTRRMSRPRVAHVSSTRVRTPRCRARQGCCYQRAFWVRAR